MTKKNKFTACMIAIMIMLFSLPANALGTVGYVELNGNTLTFKGGENVPEGAFALNTGQNNPGWNGVVRNCTTVVFDESFKDVRPTSCYKWFNGLRQLTTIEGIENLNTAEVTDMKCMFGYCSGLNSLNLSSFNTAKVTDMGDMFCGCYKLTSLDLSSFNTAEVTTMDWMFSDCSGLTTIYVSDGFTTDNVGSSFYMFLGCSNLTGAVSYDSNKTDHSMANYTTGYFTKGTTAIDQLNSVATDDAEYYDINGRRIDAPAKGVNIVRRGNKTIKVIIK